MTTKCIHCRTTKGGGPELLCGACGDRKVFEGQPGGTPVVLCQFGCGQECWFVKIDYLDGGVESFRLQCPRCRRLTWKKC